MSVVRTHDAFSLDSARRRFLFKDDFLGDQLQDLWSVSVGGTGSSAVIDAQTGGIVRLSVPAALDSAIVSWGNIRSLLISKKVIFEARIKHITGDGAGTINVGLLNNFANDAVFFYKNTGSDTVNIWSSVGGATTATGTSSSWGADYNIYRIECTPTSIGYYINNVEVNVSPITTNITALSLQPYIRLTSIAGADAKNMDVDYVVISQER